MSIEYSLKIKESKLKIDDIKKLFEKYNINKNNNYSMVSTFETLGFGICLMDERKFPYNVWDSNILNDEFEYNQVLMFSVNDDFYDFEIMYNNMYKIIFGIVKDINKESLFVSTEEICYFENNSNVIINNNEYVWENKENKKLLSDWNVKFINSNWCIEYGIAKSTVVKWLL